MTFFAFGLNFEKAPVKVREVFALDAEAKRAFYRALRLSENAELIVLSTCNRTEVYLYGDETDVAQVQAALCRRADTVWPPDAAFLVRDEDAVLHVLQVASGLRSQVLGDAQILAQMKEAYRIAVEEDGVKTVMHRLLHTAFRAAKRVIHETDLSSGAASVSSVAVAAARRHFEAEGGLTGRRVLLVGAGQMGRLVLEVLRADAPAAVAVTNRSAERAAEVAEAAGAACITWENRYAAIAEADVVVVATGAAVPVLHAAALSSAEGRNVLLIDLAVPRNVDPAADALPGYTVLDLDALTACIEQAEQSRRAEIPAAEQICEEALAEFVAWVFHQQALQPTIYAIREMFEGVRQQEVARHQSRFAEADREEIDRLTQSIVQKLLAVPIVRLKSVEPESIDFVRGVHLLNALFARPDCEDAPQPAPTPEASPRLSQKSLPRLGPAQCPLDEHAAAQPEMQPAEALLRQALRLRPGAE